MSKVKVHPFDVANYLSDEADMVAYLQAAIEEGDSALLAAALGDIARVRGMTQLARDTGLSRENLYKSLSERAGTRFWWVVQEMLRFLHTQLCCALNDY